MAKCHEQCQHETVKLSKWTQRWHFVWIIQIFLIDYLQTKGLTTFLQTPSYETNDKTLKYARAVILKRGELPLVFFE